MSKRLNILRMRGLTPSANIYALKWGRDVCEWRSAGRRVNNAHAEELMLSADWCLQHKTLCNLVLFLHFSTVCSSVKPLCAFRLFTKLTLTWYFHFYSNMSVGCFYQPCVIHWFPVPKYLNNTPSDLTLPTLPNCNRRRIGQSPPFPRSHLVLPVKGLVRSHKVVCHNELCHFTS